jgi:hypothetical protein
MRPAAAPNAPRIDYPTAAGGPVYGRGTPRPQLSWSVPSDKDEWTDWSSATTLEVGLLHSG